MIQRRQDSRFTFKTGHTLGVTSEGFGKKFDRNTAAKLCVSGLINLSHPARSKVGCNLEVCEPCADHVLFLVESGGPVHHHRDCDFLCSSWNITDQKLLPIECDAVLIHIVGGNDTRIE